MKIGFYVMQFDYRAASKSIFDYAYYNQALLDNESIVIGTNQRELSTLDKFQSHFKTILIDEDFHPNDNGPIRRRFHKIVEDEKLDAFFISYEGHNHEMIPSNCKTLVQCVFTMRHKHGDFYFAISEYLANKHGYKEFLPYIVNLPEPTKNLRKEWNIPDGAIVFGRHGGADSFHNMGDCKRAIQDIIKNDPTKYFVFINTNHFSDHPQIIYLPPTHDQQYISNFVNSCDSMLHCRNGETFGLAVGEFSYFNKPVISFIGSQDDTAHLQILGDQVIGYNDYNSLINILSSWDNNKIKNVRFDAYRQFSPENVMEKLKAEFLDK